MRIEGKGFPDQEGFLNRVGQAQGAGETDRADRREGPADGSPVSGTTEEKVVLSQGGREILRARQLAEASPEVRMEKVAELKEAIREGRYRVDAAKLADSLLRDPLLNILQ
ncbi:MAG: flagellar biosynthesis anti-sigma factor FlgM [Planctomycetota bacterium]